MACDFVNISFASSAFPRSQYALPVFKYEMYHVRVAVSIDAGLYFERIHMHFDRLRVRSPCSLLCGGGCKNVLLGGSHHSSVRKGILLKNIFHAYTTYFTQLPIRVRFSTLTIYSIQDRKYTLTEGGVGRVGEGDGGGREDK